MEMFLLGMLIMWVLLNTMVLIMDFVADNDFIFADFIRRGFPLFYLITYCIKCINGFRKLILFFPMCVKYKINPFRTSLSQICKKLDTEEARKKWLAKIKEEHEKESWEAIFKTYPL